MTPRRTQSSVITHRHGWLAALALLLIAPSPSPAQSHTLSLLPAVQKASFGTEAIDLCRLSISKIPSSPDDQRTANELRSLLASKCPAHTPQPAIPIIFEDEDKGSALPGVEDPTGPISRESYRISIDAHKLVLHGRSSAGLYYALQTLRQLIDLSGNHATLPSTTIEDWPSLAYRGAMIDMSHGGMPTLAEVKRQLDLLARFKVNQYYFYVETNIELDGYRVLNISPAWTKTEIAEIVRYAAERHIDVVPCVELYGHLHDLYRIERYSSQSALEHGGEANPA
ncbi:MAG TPA: glycoside hydrolase family 20 zincin-like fold domain-containing protein, partial [Edaphobacter sp.]